MSDRISNDEAVAFTESVLDTIDLLPYITNGGRSRDLYEVRKELEADYDETPATQNEVMQGFLFNWMDDSEFIRYLKKRYGAEHIRTYEVCTEYISYV